MLFFAIMRIFLLVLLAAISLPAQQVFEKHEDTCPIPRDHRPQVEHFVQIALASANAGGSDAAGSDYDRGNLLADIATFDACLEHFEQAAKLGDEADPSGSESQNILGRVLALQNQLAQASALEKLMPHGTDSFLYGVVEGLAEQGKFAEAEAYETQIPSPEVRNSAGQLVAVAMYKAGKKTEALAKEKALYESIPATEKNRPSLEDTELDLVFKAQDWAEIRRRSAALPAAAHGYFSMVLAVDEADAKAPSAHDDLLAAAKTYVEHRDSPHAGYLVASRLASFHDYPAAEAAAAAVHDDEWNQRAWTSIATFQAEDGKLVEARASIQKIGNGPALEHKLDMGPMGRDEARERVATALTEQGHPDIAMTFLAEQEEKEGVFDHLKAQRVATMASAGDFAKAQALVDAEIAAHSVVIDDDTRAMAAALVRPWYRKDSAAAEHWLTTLKSPALRAAAALALAAEASGEKPQVYHYFVNWD